MIGEEDREGKQDKDIFYVMGAKIYLIKYNQVFSDDDWNQDNLL